MENQFNPENILSEVSGRNPDMPTPPTKFASNPAISAIAKKENIQLPKATSKDVLGTLGKSAKIPMEDLGFWEPAAQALAKNPNRAIEFVRGTGEFITPKKKIELLENLVSSYTVDFEEKKKQFETDEDVSTIKRLNSIKKQGLSFLELSNESALNGDIEKALEYTTKANELAPKYQQAKQKITPELQARYEQKALEFQEETNKATLLNNAFKKAMNNDENIQALIEQKKEFKEKSQIAGEMAGTATHEIAFNLLKGMSTTGVNVIAKPLRAAYIAARDNITLQEGIIKAQAEFDLYQAATGTDESGIIGEIANGVGQIADAAAMISIIPGGTGSIATGLKSFSYGFSSSFFDNYVNSLETNQNPNTAFGEAFLRSVGTGASEVLVPETKLLKAIQDIPALLKGNFVKSTALNMIKNAAQEGVEEVADAFYQLGIDAVKDKALDGEFNRINAEGAYQEFALNTAKTFVVTMASSLIAGLPANANAFFKNKKDPKSYLNAALMQVASDENDFESTLSNIYKAAEKGKINEEQKLSAINKLYAYNQTFELIKNDNLSDETKAKLKNAVGIIVAEGNDEQIEDADVILYEVLSNQTTGVEAANSLIKLATPIVQKKAAEKAAKMFGIDRKKLEKNNLPQTQINNVDNILSQIQMPTTQPGDEMPEAVVKKEKAQFRLNQIEEEKKNREEAKKSIESQLSNEALSTEEKTILSERKKAIDKDIDALIHDEQIIKTALPAIEAQAQEAETKIKEQKVLNSEQKNVTQSTDAKNVSKNEPKIDTKTSITNEQADIAIKETESEFGVEVQSNITDKDGNRSAYVYAMPKDQETPEARAIRTQQAVEKLEAKGITIRNKNQPINPQTNEKQGQEGQGQREVLGAEPTPAVEATSPNKTEVASPTPTVSKTPFVKQQEEKKAKVKNAIDAVKAKSPNATPTELQKQALQEFDEEIKKAANPVAKRKELEIAIQNELKSRNLASKKARPAVKLASKKQAPKVVKGLENIKQAIAANPILPPKEEKATTPGQEIASKEGFMAIVQKVQDEIQKNPIYYGDFQNATKPFQEKITELRHTLNSVMMASYAELMSVMSVANNAARAQGINADITQQENLLKSNIFNILANKVKQELGINLPIGMQMQNIEGFEENSEKGINQAINNYIVRAAEELSKMTNSPNANYKLEFYNKVEKVANEEVLAPKFMRKAQVILNQITNNVNNDDQILEELENIDAVFIREGIHNSEYIPEAALINAFHTAIKKILRQNHNITSDANVEQVIGLMFNAFKTPYEMIAFAKRVESGQAGKIDTTTKTIYVETGKLMSTFIDRFMGDENFSPSMMIMLNNQIKSIFENRPRDHAQFDSSLRFYMLNGHNSPLARRQELARALSEAKQIIMNDTEMRNRYLTAWQKAANDPAQSWDEILEIVSMFTQFNTDESVVAGLLNDIFSIDRLQAISDSIAKDEDSNYQFNAFLTNLFAPQEEDLTKPEFSMLSLFINDYLSKRLDGGIDVPNSKIRVGNKTQNTIQRPNTISTWTDKLNQIAKKIDAKSESVWEDFMSFVDANSPLFRFVNKQLSAARANIYNPFFTIRNLMLQLREVELHSGANIKNGRDANSYFKVKNSGKTVRLISSIASFASSIKHDNKTFSVPFFPSNKPKMKMYVVGRYERTSKGYQFEEALIVGNGQTEGMYEQFINELLKNTTAAQAQIQKWIGPIWKIESTGTGAKIKLDPTALRKNAEKTLKEYLIEKAKTAVNLSPAAPMGIGSNQIPRAKAHMEIINDLASNPNKISETARKWIKQLKNNRSKEAQVLPKEYIEFLNSLTEDEALQGGISFFEDFIVNTVVNQGYLLNTFVAPIDSLIASGEQPSFVYNRVNSFIAPGLINHLGRNVRYETVRFKMEKPITIQTVDENGNPKTITLNPKRLDGVEFISPQFSIETTNAVGVFNRMVGNLKTATSGLNNLNQHVFHKNMSIMVTEEMAANNPFMRAILDRMIAGNLDKIVTTDGTKSKAEIKNATIAIVQEDGVNFSSNEAAVAEFSPESMVVQQPVYLTQASAEGMPRQNKLATQLMDQLFVFANSFEKGVELISHAANSLKANQVIANVNIKEFTSLINQLKGLKFADPNNPENDAINEEIGRQRGGILQNMITIFGDYAQGMQQILGKEASARFTNILDRIIETAQDPANPTWTFESNVKQMHEMFNDIVRDSQSVWAVGGWHPIVSEETATSKKLKFVNNNGVYEGEVVVSEQTANQLGYKNGDLVLIQKLPFNNMATKFFARVIIGNVNGSSLALPVEWADITSSDFDADSVGTLKINENYQADYESKLNNIREGLVGLSQIEAVNALADDKIALKKYLRAKAEYEAQALLNKMHKIHSTDPNVNNMQLQTVTTKEWEQSAQSLGFTVPEADPFDVVNQSERAEGIKTGQQGIGIDASATNTILRMAFTGSSLPNGGRVSVMENGKEFKPGKPQVDNQTVEKDGKSMIDQLSNFLQIMVDSYKHNYAQLMGINNENILHALLLTQTGLAPKTVLTMINQPLFKLYSEIMANSSNNMLPNNLRSTTALFHLRETLAQEVLKRKMNKSLLEKIGFTGNDRVPYTSVDKMNYVVDANKIKNQYPGLTITNLQEEETDLALQLGSMSNEALEAQLEVYQVIAGMRNMTKALEEWIYVRKKFQEGVTDPSQVSALVGTLEGMGIIAPLGEKSVPKTAFNHSFITDANVIQDLENKISNYETILDALNTGAIGNLQPVIDSYYNQGFDKNSLEEYLDYKIRLLHAARVNGTWMNTFYVADPFFAQQVDGFFMGAAQSASVVEANKQRRMEAMQAEIKRVSSGAKSQQVAYESNDATLLNIARNSLAQRVLEKYNPDTLSTILADFTTAMQSVLDKMYKFKPNFNNGFIQNLESIPVGDTPAIGTRKGHKIYTSQFFLYNQMTRETINESEVKDANEIFDSLLESIGLKNEFDSVIENEDLNPAEKFDAINDIINSITEAQAAQYGVNLETAQFLVQLSYLEKSNPALPLDFVMYNGFMYDAATGYPMFGSEKNKEFAVANPQDIERMPLVPTENPDLRKLQRNVSTLRQLMNFNSNMSGADVATAYIQAVHNKVSTYGLTPKYNKGKQTRVQLSVNREVGALNFDSIKEGLAQLATALYEPITIVKGNELVQSSLIEELDVNPDIEAIISAIQSGDFDEMYALYFTETANSYNAWSHIKPMLKRNANQTIYNNQKNFLENSKSPVEIETLIFREPKITDFISWEMVQDMNLEDSKTRNFKDYVHTIDPEGNLILFKKVLITGEGVNRFATQAEREQTVATATRFMFFPVGFYGYDQQGNFAVIGSNTTDPLQVLEKIDSSQLNQQNILKMISGIVAANNLDQKEKTFDMLQLQQRLMQLAGEYQMMSPEAIVKRITQDAKLQDMIEQAVGWQKADDVMASIEKIGKFAKDILYTSQSTKLFQNTFLAETGSAAPKLTEAVNPSDVKTVFQTPGNTNKLTPKKRASAKASVLTALRNASGKKLTNTSVGNFFQNHNNGKLPTTFREAVGATLQQINSNPAFSSIAQLLITKVGNAKVVFLDNAAYEQEEIGMGYNAGATNMFYNSANDTIYMNSDAQFDLEAHPEALLHEGVHSLTLDLYFNDPSFKQGIDNITSEFASQYNAGIAAPNTKIANWKAANPLLASVIETEIISRMGVDNEAAGLEFLAYALSTADGKMFELLNEMKSGPVALPSQAPKTLWARFMHKIAQGLGIKAQNKTLYTDLMSMMSSYYDVMGPTAANSVTQTNNAGTHINVNGQIFTSSEYIMETYLLTQGTDFTRRFETYFQERYGRPVDPLEQTKFYNEKNEIEAIKLLMYKAKYSQSANQTLNSLLSIASPRAKMFFNQFQSLIDGEYNSAGELTIANDLRVAGVVDGTFYMSDPTGLNPDELILDAVHVQSYGDYEAAMNHAINTQEKIGELVGGLQTPPPLKTLIKAGIDAYIKESQGEKVHAVRIMTVDANGGVSQNIVPYSLIRAYIHDLMASYHSTNISTALRFQNEVDNGENPSVSAASKGNVLSLEDPSITMEGHTNPFEALIARKNVEIATIMGGKSVSEINAPLVQIEMMQKMYKTVMGALYSGEYKTYTKEKLQSFNGAIEYLKQLDLIKDATYNYANQEYMKQMEGVQVKDIVNNIRHEINTPFGVRDVTSFGFETFAKILISPVHYSKFKAPILKLFYRMNQSIDRMYTEAQQDRIRAAELWKKVTEQGETPGFMTALKRNVRMNAAKEIHYLSKFANEKADGTWVFKKNPTGLTPIETEYYNFITGKVESIMRELYNDSFGGNPFLGKTEISNYFKYNPQTGEHELAEIPVPASGMQYRSQLHNMLHSFVGEKPTPMHELLIETQLHQYGYIEVEHRNPVNKEMERKTLQEWTTLLAGTPAYMADLKEIQEKTRSNKQVKTAKTWKHFAHKINMRSFKFGGTIRKTEEGASFDLQHNLGDFLMEAHAVKTGMLVAQYSKALNYITDQGIEKDSNIKKWMNDFISSKYKSENKAKKDPSEAIGTKVVRFVSSYLTLNALGLNIPAQITDLIADQTRILADSGHAKKYGKGVFDAMRLMFSNTDQENSYIIRAFNATKNMEEFKQLFSMDAVFDNPAMYKKLGGHYVADKLMGSMFGMYKFNEYIRMMSVMSAELGYAKTKKIMEDVKSGIPMSKETIEEINKASDKYLALMGGITKATAVRHIDLSMKEMLKFKTWIPAAFRAKWGMVGAETGTAKNIPVWSGLYAKAVVGGLRMYESKFNKKLQTSEGFLRLENAVNSYTPEENARHMTAVKLNLLQILGSGLYLLSKYLDDPGEEENFWKNFNEMLEHRPLDAMIALSMFTAGTLGAPITAIFGGIAAFDMVTALPSTLLKPVGERSKWKNKTAKLVAAYVPGAKMVKMANPEWFLTEEGINKINKYRDKKSLANMHIPFFE